jgi:hypothetical protein
MVAASSPETMETTYTVRSVRFKNDFRILKEDLGKTNLCARFVSHSLTPEKR